MIEKVHNPKYDRLNHHIYREILIYVIDFAHPC